MVAVFDSATTQYTSSLSVLPYLWDGEYSLPAIANELSTGSAIVRSRCQQLSELGITSVAGNGDYYLTDIGKEFCRVLYKPVAELKQINLENNLLKIAVNYAKIAEKPNQSRIKLLEKFYGASQQQSGLLETSTNTESNSASTGNNNGGNSENSSTQEADAGKEPSDASLYRRDNPQATTGLVSKKYWRLKSNLDVVYSFQEKENVIACHELSIAEQIQFCYDRIALTNKRSELYKGCKPKIFKELEKQTKDIFKEEDNRISQLGYYLPQPSWITEAEAELNHLQGQIDISAIEADKATDKDLKKALNEAYKVNQKAFVEAIERYVNIATDCGGKLNYCSSSEDGTEYQKLTVWLSHQQISEIVETPNLDSSTPVAQIAEITPTEVIDLTPEEEQEKTRLEKKVDHGMYSAWSALREIHDRKLYRPALWINYVKERFGFSRVYADLQIHAANVYDVVEGTGVAPISERQVRSMRSLDQEDWNPVWTEAIAKTNGKPTAKVVNSIVDRIKQKTSRTLEFKLGDVVIINRPIKYSGCWGIVEELDGREFTISVSTWKEEAVLIEDPDKVTRVDSPSEQATILGIWHRCKRLRECNNLDPSVYWVLEGFGRQTFLTEVQEELLIFFEKKYL